MQVGCPTQRHMALALVQGWAGWVCRHPKGQTQELGLELEPLEEPCRVEPLLG